MKSYKISINGNQHDVNIQSIEGEIAKVTVNGVEYEAKIEGMAQRQKPVVSAVKKVVAPTPVPEAAPASAPAQPRAAASVGGNSVKSPLPGVILGISVKEGDTVAEGDQLLILEAMKMENSIEADCAGTVKAIAVRQGDSVLEGDVLITIG